MRILISRGRVLVPQGSLSDFVFFYCVLGVLLGGRLGFCLFYSPELFLQFSSQFPFWGILEVHKGGMSSHGGMIGVAFSSYLFSKKYKIPFLHVFDLTVPSAAIGFFFGRIANFINGELFGRSCSETFIGAMKFPQEMLRWFSNHHNEKLKLLSPLVEKLGEVELRKGFFISANQETWIRWISEGHQNAYLYIEYMIQQIQANQSLVIDFIEPLLTPRYPSQLFQSLLEGLCVFLLLNLVWIRPRKPGVLAAFFALFYAVARIVGEQYRLPDADLGYELLGLTRGQWLSVVLLITGAGLGSLIYLRFRKVKKLGGWFDDKKK